MTNTQYMKSGNTFIVSSKAAMDLHDELPVGTYTVQQNPQTGAYYLQAIENFEIKGKVYGDTNKTAERILNTFESRDNSTGVMLSGEKGSGKTLLAKKLSLQAQKEKGIPTIVINQPHAGEGFNAFMQMIEQPTIVIFDEFEKVYNKEDQEHMLTLLDGVYPSKKLFILTCNDKWRVNEHMRNRPGRIFYRLEYKGLEDDFIREYCADNLKNQTHTESICRMAVLFSEFNFDMLKALVEDMNRYDESPQEVMKFLNAKPEQNDISRYAADLQVPDVVFTEETMVDAEWAGNPLAQPISIDYLAAKKDSKKKEWVSAVFSHEDLKKVDSASGKFHFQNVKGETLSLVKVKPPQYEWTAAL